MSSDSSRRPNWFLPLHVPPWAAAAALRATAALAVAWGPLLAAWLTLHWGILPHIDEWRPQVERRAGSALGLPLTVGNISVRSAGWVPAFELQDVRVFDRQGREALRLDDADGVTWRSRVQADEAVRKAIRPQPAPQPNATPGPARTPPAP